MTAAQATITERPTEKDSHSSPTEAQSDQGSLSAEVWAMARAVVDRTVAVPVENGLDYVGAASLYKSVIGQPLPRLSSSIEEQTTPRARVAYAAGQAIADGLLLEVLMRGAPPAVRWLNARGMVQGAKIFQTGESLRHAAAAYSAEGLFSSTVARGLQGTASLLKSTGNTLQGLRGTHEYVELGAAGFAHGLLTADSRDSNWSHRLQSAALGTVGLIGEKSLGRLINENTAVRVRTVYREHGPLRIGDRPEIAAGVLAGILIAPAAATAESLVQHRKMPSEEQLLGSILGHAVSGAIVGAHAQGSFQSLGNRLAYAQRHSKSNYAPVPMLGM
jgi:hypothetical protein